MEGGRTHGGRRAPSFHRQQGKVCVASAPSPQVPQEDTEGSGDGPCVRQVAVSLWNPRAAAGPSRQLHRSCGARAHGQEINRGQDLPVLSHLGLSSSTPGAHVQDSDEIRSSLGPRFLCFPAVCLWAPEAFSPVALSVLID